MSWLLHQTACGHCLLRAMSRRHGNFRRKVWKSGDPRFTLVMCNSWTCMVQYMWRLFYQKGCGIRSSMQEAQRCQARHPQPLAGRHSPVQSRGLARSEMEMSVIIRSSGLPIPPSPKGMLPLPSAPSRGRDAWYHYPIMHRMLVPRSKNGKIYTTLLLPGQRCWVDFRTRRPKVDQDDTVASS